MTRVLSFHAEWQCRHSGRCCTSNWTIPLEAPALTRVEGALEAGTLHPVSPTDAPLDRRDDAVLVGRHGAHCVFHDHHPIGGCRIQRALGHEALPLACRQFPRVVVRHGSSVSITLSHYCPSARALLDAPAAPATIVTNPRAFPAHGEYVGLDAADDLPPLLRPDCAFDRDAWWLFESRAVTLLCEEDWTGLTRLHQVVERLRTWRPGDGRLTEAVHRAFDLARLGSTPAWTPQQADTERLVRDLLASVPAEWHAVAEDALKATHGTPPAVHPARDGRFLAAHAFANWTAYNGRDLRAWYRSIEAAGMLLRATGDPGQTDLVLRHLCDTAQLTRRWQNGAEVAR